MTDSRKVRVCNWVRFVRVATAFNPGVNFVATKVRGEPVYEAVKAITPDTELLVYYLPERPEELFFVSMRASFYRQKMDSILEGKYSVSTVTKIKTNNKNNFAHAKKSLESYFV